MGKLLRVVLQVIGHKTGYEVIAVVVTRMPAQRKRLPGRSAGGFKQMWVQLLGQKLVRQALVNQDAAGVGRCCVLAHQCRGVMRCPA